MSHHAKAKDRNGNAPEPVPIVQPAEPAEPSKREEEFAGVRGELDAARKEIEARDQKIDEIARAYSAHVNEQKEYRVRIEREKERFLETERGKIALHLMQVSDEIERALASAKGDEGPLSKGVQLIHEGLAKTLATLGLARLSLVGTPFDPNLAEAVDVVPVADSEIDGEVLSEISAGYKLGERVVRPARVRVARYQPRAN